jgi:hypothetical protein
VALAFAVLGAGLLAGCGGGGGAPPSVSKGPTNAALALTLELRPSNAAQAHSLGDVYGQVFSGCPAHFTAFTEGGRAPTPVSFGPVVYVQAYEETASCAGTGTARSVFHHDASDTEARRIGGTPLSGIGSEAVTASMPTNRAREDVIFWRDGTRLGFVQLSGPLSDTRITLAETESLARGQIAAG